MRSPSLPRRGRRAGVLVAVAALAAVAAPSAQALEVGLQDDGAFLYQTVGSRPVALSLAGQLRVGHLRSIVFWNRIAGRQATLKRAPKHPIYDFGQLDGLAAAADAAGIKLQLVLTGKSPAYATADHRVGNTRPSPKLYAQWVKAVVTRYRGRGYRYSLWNEPNFQGWLQPLKDAPRLYPALVKAGYKAAKQADPGAEILVGELASYTSASRSIAPLDFLRRMRAAGARNLPADGFAYHPYDLTHAPGTVSPVRTQVTLGSLPRLFKGIDTSGVFRRGLPVYLTEWGYATTGARGIGTAKQATYTAQALALAGAQPRVRELVQYGLYARPGTSFDTGIVSELGVPFPAFGVLRDRVG